MQKKEIDGLIDALRDILMKKPVKEHVRFGDYSVYTQGPLRRPCLLFPPTMRVVRMPGWEDGDNTKDVYCLQSPDTILFFPKIEYRPHETIIPTSIVATRVKIDSQEDLDKAIAECVVYAADPASGEIQESEVQLSAGEWSSDASIISKRLIEVVSGRRQGFAICNEIKSKPDDSPSRIITNIDYQTYLPVDHPHRPGEFAAILRVIAQGFHQASLLMTPCKICHDYCNGNHGQPWKMNCEHNPLPPKANDETPRTP